MASKKLFFFPQISFFSSNSFFFKENDCLSFFYIPLVFVIIIIIYYGSRCVGMNSQRRREIQRGKGGEGEGKGVGNKCEFVSIPKRWNGNKTVSAARRRYIFCFFSCGDLFAQLLFLPFYLFDFSLEEKNSLRP